MEAGDVNKYSFPPGESERPIVRNDGSRQSVDFSNYVDYPHGGGYTEFSAVDQDLRGMSFSNNGNTPVDEDFREDPFAHNRNRPLDVDFRESSFTPSRNRPVIDLPHSENIVQAQNGPELSSESHHINHAPPKGFRPSNDREDISDEEFDDDRSFSVGGRSDPTNVPLPSQSVMQQAAHSLLPISSSCSGPSHVFSRQTSFSPGGYARYSNESVVPVKSKEYIEENSNILSGDSQRKVQNEDLEAVSDDEFVPETTQNLSAAENSSSTNRALVVGGEDVSSSEDEGPASPDSSYNEAHQIDLSVDAEGVLGWEPSEVSQGSGDFPEGAQTADDDKSIKTANISLELSTSARLASLEPEPISDEDIDNKSLSDGDAVEAGEVKSPKAPTQPVEELLREVEPVSADESSDTDGELPSGDEDSNSKKKMNDNGFESIDSDEGDMGLGSSVQKQSLSSSNHERLIHKDKIVSAAEQSCDKDGHNKVQKNDSVSGDKLTSGISDTEKKSHSGLTNNSHMKDLEADKRHVTGGFNEHQEELDYEENEGDETDPKMEDTKLDSKSKEDGEEGEVDEDANDDKDEGECSDDDCEEGEIKEPGMRKPFMKPICRFFQRGNCTWGINCRFLHPGINDKGNYQMIEIPGFNPPNPGPPMGLPAPWEEPEEQVELPPPPIPDVPPVETAWERGLRIAKEQRKKASERKEKEPDFEEKRLNLKLDEDKEVNKENERIPKVIVKDPYYDQQAYEEDEYYKLTSNPWQTGHYENFEVRYNREHSFSPPYREKPPGPTSRYIPPPYSPTIDKFGRQREERRPPFRPEPPVHDYPSPAKKPDEWTDPWRRSKSPQTKRKPRSRSRGRRNRRSVSDSSNSSRSGSSSSGSSRSSRSGSGSSGSSSRSRSPEPAPPGVDRHDRYGHSPARYGDQPRSAVTVRGRGGYHFDRRGGGRGGRGNDFRFDRKPGQGFRGRGYRGEGRGGYKNNYGGPMDRDPRAGRGGRDDRFGRNRGRSPPDRPLPYVRPRPKSVSSHSSSSRSRSRSRSRYSDSSHSRSRSRSSSNSSRSSSSSSSSAGSADSDHLYRDLGSPTRPTRGSGASLPKKKRTNSHKDRPDRTKPGAPPGSQASQKHSLQQQQPNSGNPDRIPHPRDSSKSGQQPPPSSRQESKYASRNAPQAPVKAKDPLKMMGQKSNIKLTLLPKQQQQSNLGNRPNPLDSPPHKRRISERDTSPVPAPPAKRPNVPMPTQASALRLASEKAAKTQLRQEKGKSPQPVPMPASASSSASSFSSVSAQRAKAAVSPQKQASSKPRIPEPAVGKAAPKVPAAAAPTASATGTKTKKSMSSRREELLKQLKAVEDAIMRKKTKLN